MSRARREAPNLWDLIDRAMALEDIRKLHLAVGRPPLVRVGEGDLQPLDDELPLLTANMIQVMLGYVVDPERWDFLEAVGEGEFRLARGVGRPLTVTVFRNSSAWSAVVHF